VNNLLGSLKSKAKEWQKSILQKRNQMKKLTIVVLVMLLDAVAFAQIPSDANLRILISSLSETNVSGIVSNTQTGVH